MFESVIIKKTIAGFIAILILFVSSCNIIPRFDEPISEEELLINPTEEITETEGLEEKKHQTTEISKTFSDTDTAKEEILSEKISESGEISHTEKPDSSSATKTEELITELTSAAFEETKVKEAETTKTEKVETAFTETEDEEDVCVPNRFVITEVMSSNKKYIPYNGKCYDWVELYNGSDKTLNLGDYYLSDDSENLKKYNLPNVSLKHGQYYIVMCSGLSDQGHASFKISSDGEEIFLSHGKDAVIIDSLLVPGDLKQNESYGRYDGNLVYMSASSPGQANNKGYDSSLEAPVADIATGLYDKTLSVSLSGEGKIYYTLDGEDPSTKSNLYSKPVAINKSVSLRAVCYKDGRTSEIASYTYLINTKHVYPVINITIKKENLTGSKGVLVNTTGTEYEYQAYISMMDGGTEMFSAPCGFKLHGNDSKKGVKQNFQIRFRSKYGLGTLEYPLFENRDYNTFNSLILHGGSEDCLRAGFRDELCTSIVDGTTHLYVLACRPVVLYLNGEYWGMYWVRERFDALYCANNLGVSKESINLLHTYGSISDGSNKEYLALEKFCRDNDLRIAENYGYVMDRIDAYSLMDWYICRSYFADRDLANIRFFQSTDEKSDKKWRWCFFDLDWSFYHDGNTSIEKTMPDNGHHIIIRSLLKNPEFKQMFIERYIELMKTCLSDENILKHIEKFENQFRPELDADRKRFGSSVKAWANRVGDIKSYIGEGKRQGEMIENLKSLFGVSQNDIKTLIEKYSQTNTKENTQNVD